MKDFAPTDVLFSAINKLLTSNSNQQPQLTSAIPFRSQLPHPTKQPTTCLPQRQPFQLHAVVATAAVSAQKRLSARAASSLPCTATARKLRQRTRSKVLDAHAVSTHYQLIKHRHHICSLRSTDLSFPSDQRPAGACTCSRSSTENAKVAGSACACGKRPKGDFIHSFIFSGGWMSEYVLIGYTMFRFLHLWWY